jgi:hypothetical protein
MPLLTPGQFAKTAAAKKPGATYKTYKTYVDTTTKKRAAARASAAAQAPFQVTAPGDLSRGQILQAAQQQIPYDPYYNPLSGAQMASQAQSMVNPTVQAAIENITKQAMVTGRAGTNAISGYTNDLYNKLTPLSGQVGDIYNAAQGEQSNVTAALANFVRDQGSHLQSQLQNQESAAGQTNAGSLQAGAVGAGASGATAAYGLSSLERLIGQGAAEQSYAAQLPGIAKIGGQQQLGQFQTGVVNDLSKQTGDITAQVPGMVQNAWQTLVDREGQKAQGRVGLNTARSNVISGYNEQNAARDSAWQGVMNDALNRNQSQAQFTAEQQRLTDQFNADPSNNPTWGDKLSKSIDSDAMRKFAEGIRYPGGIDPTTGKPAIDPNTGKPNSRMNTWAVVRSKVAGQVRAAVPGLPPQVVTQYVDDILRAAGWPGAKAAAAQAAAWEKKKAGKGKGKGSTVAAGPPGTTGPVGVGPQGPPGMSGPASGGITAPTNTSGVNPNIPNWLTSPASDVSQWLQGNIDPNVPYGGSLSDFFGGNMGGLNNITNPFAGRSLPKNWQKWPFGS